MDGHRPVLTGRLELTAVTLGDVDDLYAPSSDPVAAPALRPAHRTRVRWRRRLHGPARRGLNLYYRFRPEAHGKGFTGELVEAARRSAAALRPELVWRGATTPSRTRPQSGWSSPTDS